MKDYTITDILAAHQNGNHEALEIYKEGIEMTLHLLETHGPTAAAEYLRKEYSYIKDTEHGYVYRSWE